MPNTKVRKKSLLESYLEGIPLGSTLESFCDKRDQDSTSSDNDKESLLCTISPFGLVHFKDSSPEYVTEYTRDDSVESRETAHDTASISSAQDGWNSNLSAEVDDIIDEGYNSSQLPHDLNHSIDSSNSEEDSERDKVMPSLDCTNGSIRSSAASPTTPHYKVCSSVGGTQVKDIVNRLSKSAERCRLKSSSRRQFTTTITSKQRENQAGDNVAHCISNGDSDTTDSGSTLCPTDSSTHNGLPNGHLKSKLDLNGLSVTTADEPTAKTVTCCIENSTVLIKPLKTLNYTTAKSFSRNKSIMMGSVGLTSPELNLSQDSFVANSKELARHKLSPVVPSTMANGHSVVLTNDQFMKRNIKPVDDKPVECKQNTQDVKEIYKNQKPIWNLEANTSFHNTGKNLNVVNNVVSNTTSEQNCSDLVITSTVPTISSYYLFDSNPTLNHDKVKLESGDKENIKECVVGRKPAIGAVTTTAQSNGCCGMERRVSFNLKPECFSSDASNDSKVGGSGEHKTEEGKEISTISSKDEKTDSKNHGPARKPFDLTFSRGRVSILKKTKSLDVKEISGSAQLHDEDTNLVCDDSFVDYRDFEVEKDDLTQRIDEDLLKYINYEFPGVEALCESISEQHETDSSISDQIVNSLQDFLEKQETMENVRLQKVLLEVEQARSGTVKALLQVNAVLNRVQGENMKLEGDLKSMVQEKEYLRETLAELKKKSEVDEGVAISAFKELCSDGKNEQEHIMDKQRREELEQNMKIFLQSTKREKRDLLQALAKSTNRAESAQRDAEKLRIQFRKVKEQLETSNTTFSKILKHNLKATQKLEEELQSALNEKKILLESLQTGTAHNKELEELRDQLQECQTNLQDTLMERDQLNKKIVHLEKQKKDLKSECEELQEQIDHTQEMIDNLTDSTDELKEKLKKAVGEKNYLQSCLDETGNLLVHLRNNEKKLKEEKGTLEEDLESEMQQNESLQASLRKTTSEHKSLVDRLQAMNTTHDTVQETLKEASQKEEYYKNQIDDLNKNNHLMHYMLEKEKEERSDLRELYDSLEVNYNKLRRETTEELLILRQNLEELTVSNKELTEQNGELLKTSTDLRNSLEQEEEDNTALRKTISWNEQHKEKLEKEAQFLRERREESDKEITDLKKKLDELQKLLRRETEKADSLSHSMESRDELFTKVSNDLSLARSSLHEKDKLINDLSTSLKDKEEEIADLNKKIEALLKEREEQKEKYHETEKECKMSQKACLKYKSELEKLEDEHAKLEQERNMIRRGLTDRTNDFELHKVKCSETARSLREEIASLHSQLIEKDRLVMKQKEHYQDTIDNTNSDLALLRQFMENEVYTESSPNETRSRSNSQGNDLQVDQPDIDLDAIDVDFLRSVHQQFESEMQSHVDNLEGMLHVSRQTNDSVTVVQSPMSKIKLEEIKVLRDETFELRTEVKDVLGKLNIVVGEVSTLKGELGGTKGLEPTERRKKISERTPDLEEELRKLNESISKIEARHVSVVRRNSSLLDYARKKIKRTRNLEKEKDNQGSGEENSEKFDREIMVLTLKEENLKLKAFVNFLDKKINLRDGQLLRSLISSREGNKVSSVDGKAGNHGNALDYEASSRGSVDNMDRLAPNTRRSYMKSKSARTSPNVERIYTGRSFSGASSPVSQSRFRPISPAPQRYPSSADESDSSSSYSLRYARSVSDYVPSTATRILSKGRLSESDQLGSSRRESQYDNGDDTRQRRLSRNSDGDPSTSPYTRRKELDTNNNLVRRKSADWDYESKGSSRKGYGFLDNESSMYQYQDSQGGRLLRQKISDRYRSGDSTSGERQSGSKLEGRGFAYTSALDSQRSKTLPRSRTKYP